MSELNADGNTLGRLGAFALIAAAGFGLHRLIRAGGMCPVLKTGSCCAGAGGRAKAEVSKAAPAAVPADPAK